MEMVLVGAGQRGRVYAGYWVERGLGKITAIAEPHEGRRLAAAQALGVPAGSCYPTAEALWAAGRLGDAAIIASMDQDHYAQVMAALDLGYDLLLEKPISPVLEECLAIGKKAADTGRQVVVCHVLRYTPFFSTLKQLVDGEELGRVVSIQLNENVGNFHMAHSFVRGNWRRADTSSPIILQKSCHDMDILTWLAGAQARQVISFGGLRYFRKENAPPNSAGRCFRCPVEPDCRFSAYQSYLPARGGWPATVVSGDQSEEGLRSALETSPYGRCVYRCDNDVCDTQMALLEFENGVSANFQLSGLTSRICRTIRIFCEDGEISGDDGEGWIEVTRFPSNQVEGYEKRVIIPPAADGGHGGGDEGLMEDFVRLMKRGDRTSLSSVDRSLESHLMAMAAERSRLESRVVKLAELRQPATGQR